MCFRRCRWLLLRLLHLLGDILSRFREPIPLGVYRAASLSETTRWVWTCNPSSSPGRAAMSTMPFDRYNTILREIVLFHRIFPAWIGENFWIKDGWLLFQFLFSVTRLERLLTFSTILVHTFGVKKTCDWGNLWLHISSAGADWNAIKFRHILNALSAGIREKRLELSDNNLPRRVLLRTFSFSFFYIKNILSI